MRRKIGAIGETMECGLKKLKRLLRFEFPPVDDPEHSDDEDRFILTGMSSTGRLYKKSDSAIRIISAQKATKKEFMFYEEGI
jgi:uncharacterized DUF497 family protein